MSISVSGSFFLKKPVTVDESLLLNLTKVISSKGFVTLILGKGYEEALSEKNCNKFLTSRDYFLHIIKKAPFDTGIYQDMLPSCDVTLFFNRTPDSPIEIKIGTNSFPVFQSKLYLGDNESKYIFVSDNDSSRNYTAIAWRFKQLVALFEIIGEFFGSNLFYGQLTDDSNGGVVPFSYEFYEYHHRKLALNSSGLLANSWALFFGEDLVNHFGKKELMGIPKHKKVDLPNGLLISKDGSNPEGIAMDDGWKESLKFFTNFFDKNPINNWRK